jgi:hypothetical protein
MSNFKRQNTSSSKIKDNFSKDVDAENRKIFLIKLVLLIIGISFFIFLFWPSTPPPPPAPPYEPVDTTIIIDTPVPAPPPKIKITQPIESISNNPDAVFGNFKASFESKKQEIINDNPQYASFEFKSFAIYKVNGLIVTRLNIIPSKQGFSKFRVVLNPVGAPTESLDNTLSKNEGSSVLNSQILNGYEYHLVGLK